MFAILFLALCFASRVHASTPSYLAVDAIFREHCLDCHASNEPEARLVLESFESLMKGGESGASIASGQAGESLLVKMIEGNLEKDGGIL